MLSGTRATVSLRKAVTAVRGSHVIQRNGASDPTFNFPGEARDI